MIVHRHPEGHRPIKMWTNPALVEPQALKQLEDLSTMRFIPKSGIAVMPDVHWGTGTSVGTVIPTVRAIIPATVGVDIGCGMSAVRTGLSAKDLPDSLAPMRSKIEEIVHSDGSMHKKQQNILQPEGTPIDLAPFGGLQRADHQIGTLGGGNHFVEVCLDEEDRVWAMLHSGSRGVGNKIGVHYISLAKEMVLKWGINLPDVNLAWLPDTTDEFHAYVTALRWAQDYAAKSRALMMGRVLAAIHTDATYMRMLGTQTISCHHNYVEMEHHGGEDVWLTRKGAIRARLGDMGIIPGSMGAASYIVRGKGNAESYHSCAHGAGRAMSRKAARERFTVADLEAQTRGIECRKDNAVLDEIPSAYKNIDQVMAQQNDLAEIVHTLHQVLNVKGV